MEVELPDLLSRIIYATGQWEPQVTRYVRSALKRGDTFIDVGANIGYYTLLASRLIGDSGRVIAIEASSPIANRLARNVARNHCRNVTVIHAAAAASKGQLQVFDGKEHNRGRTTTVSDLAARKQLTSSESVAADTLENLVGSDVLRSARIIKVDVEGAEREVLGSILASLTNFSADTEWILELRPEHCPNGHKDVSEVVEAFVAAGYTPRPIPNTYDLRFMLGIVEPRPDSLRDTPLWHQADVLMSRRLGDSSASR